MGNYHWYHAQTAEPMHDNDLRAARKLGLYPSVTTIQKAWSMSPFLERWISRQKMRKTLLSPFTGLATKYIEREDCYSTRTCYEGKFDVIAKGSTAEESKKNYYIEAERRADELQDQIEQWSDDIDNKAYEDLNATAEHGLAVHDQLEQYCLNQDFKFDPKYEDFCNPFRDIFSKHIQSVEFTEVRRVCHTHSMAGTLDLTIVSKETGLIEVWDYKARKFKDGRSVFHDKDRTQLAFYAWMTKNNMGLDYMPRTRNLGIIRSNDNEFHPTGIIEMKLWREDAQQRGLDFMIGLAAAWRADKNYYV